MHTNPCWLTSWPRPLLHHVSWSTQVSEWRQQLTNTRSLLVFTLSCLYAHVSLPQLLKTRTWALSHSHKKYKHFIKYCLVFHFANDNSNMAPASCPVKQINRDLALLNWNARRRYENSLSHILIRKHTIKILTNSVFGCLKEGHTFSCSIDTVLIYRVQEVVTCFLSCCDNEYVNLSDMWAGLFCMWILSKWFQNFCFTLNIFCLRSDKPLFNKDFNKERDRESVCNEHSSNVTNLTSILVLMEYTTAAC